MKGMITVGSVTRKEGTSKKTGKPWTKYIIHDQATEETYETFDAAVAKRADDAHGKYATVEFKATQYGNDLESFEVSENGAQPLENLPSHVKPDGSADWDIVGLRKTRCSLWNAFLSSEMARAILAHPEENVEKAVQIARVGSRLVELAEADIYHRQPAAKDTDIPF